MSDTLESEKTFTQELKTQLPKGVIPELEGLRGLLAWWVVFHHICLLTNSVEVMRHVPVIGHILINGSRPVFVFVILSGFFITGSLWRDGITWGSFMTRRFRRIYPAYLVSLCFAALTLPFFLKGMHALPWQDWIVVQTREASNEVTAQHPGLFALLYLTLTQGLMPLQIGSYHPLQPIQFLNPSWSLSLEWQFYLVVPFFVWLFRRGGALPYVGALLIALVILGGERLCAFDPGHGPVVYALPSFLPLCASLFFLGGTSLVIRRTWLKAGWAGISWQLQGLFAALVLLVAVQHLAVLLMWLAVLAASVPGIVSATLGRLLRLRFLQYLGMISYSTYIFHITLVDGVVILLCGAMPHLTPLRAFLLSCVLIPPLVLVCSIVLYRQVEHRFYHMSS